MKNNAKKLFESFREKWKFNQSSDLEEVKDLFQGFSAMNESERVQEVLFMIYLLYTSSNIYNELYKLEVKDELTNEKKARSCSVK